MGRAALPSVLVPDLPSDVVRWPAFLANLPQLRRTEVTDADRRRVTSYAAANKRNELRENVQSLEVFLATLNQEITLTRLNGDGPALVAGGANVPADEPIQSFHSAAHGNRA